MSKLVRLYHGTSKDFDKFTGWENRRGNSGSEVFLTPSLSYARLYAIGGINQDSYVPLHEQRIIAVDLPSELFNKYHVPMDDETIIPYYVVNEYVIDDGRDNVLYGDPSWYNDKTLLPIDLPEKIAPSNRIFNNPDNNPDAEYNAYSFLAAADEPGGVIVHSFDKYSHVDGKTFYMFNDGSVLESDGPDPAKYGFHATYTMPHKTLPQGEYDWIPYNKVLHTKPKRRMNKYVKPKPILVGETKKKPKLNNKIPAPRRPGIGIRRRARR